MKKHLKKILSFGVALSILSTTLLMPTASTDVEVKVQSTPKIDIMLTSKDTNLNLNNFESDVLQALKQKGINTSNINFTTIERVENEIKSNDLDVDTIINNWKKVGDTSWVASNGEVYGNSSSSYIGGMGLFANDNFEGENFKMSFTMTTGGNQCYGVAFNVKELANGIYSGYFINIACHNNGGWNLPYYECRLWRFDRYTLDTLFYDNYQNTAMSHMWCWRASHSPQSTGSNSGVSPWIVGEKTSTANGDSITCLAAWNGSLSNVKYNISATDGRIIITMNDEIVCNYYDNTFKSGTVGFWGNSCEQTTSMHLKDISIETSYEKVKTYKEVLTEPTWREDAKHIVVNVDDTIDNTLTSTATIGEILSRTLADDIHFIQWGTDTNKSATTNFIKQNDNKGLFTYNNNYNKAIEDTVNYIKTLVDYTESEEQYITIGQEINLTVTPEGFEKNAISDKYPNGRWKINHDHKYFTNNLGQSADAGIYSPNLNCNFDKPGKYEITFDDKVVKTIYVHRKPIADFEIDINNLVIDLKNVSYDLDSTNGNGIASEKWYYKEVSESNWTEGKLTQLDKTKIYVIKLEVTDNEGITSYTTKYVGTGNPVSKFNFANDTICKYNKLEINNTSYDPIGYDIITESWELKKDGQIIGTYSKPILDFNIENLGSGNYTYTLTVTNSVGTKSETYTKTFTVVDDVAKPEVSIEAEVNNNWNTETDVNVEISDNESNVAKWRYEFVTSPTPTKEDNEWSNWDTEKTEMTINSGALSGRYYLHIQAYDSANNLTERTIGPFNLDNTNPVINGVDVEKQGFRDNKVTIHAFDEHSGIVGYALTKYEPTTYSARTITTPELPEFQESNEFNVDSDGLYTAWVIDALGNIETSVCEVTNSNQTDKTTTVYAEIGSEFKVTIPKKIVLDGATKSGTYQVTVEGDIAGLEVINVTPDSAVTLSSKDKADVIGTITQDKLNWTYSEIYTDSKILANGSISASGITAGAWNGTFNFAIKLENNGKYTNSIWDVEYQDITFDMEELDNSEVTEPTE